MKSLVSSKRKVGWCANGSAVVPVVGVTLSSGVIVFGYATAVQWCQFAKKKRYPQHFFQFAKKTSMAAFPVLNHARQRVVE